MDKPQSRQQANTLDLRQPIPPAPPPKRKHWHPNRKFFIIVITLTAIIVLILGILLVKNELAHRAVISQIPVDILERAEFPLYVPQQLPDGFSLDKDSFSFQQNVATFVVTYNYSKKLVFTEQAKPSGVDVKGLYSSLFRFSQPISTPHGQVYIGRSVSGTTSASLVTDHTWILAATDGGINHANLEQIMQQLVKSP